jgi:hypothetical protein
MTRFPGVVDLRISIFIFVHFCRSTFLNNTIYYYLYWFNYENYFFFWGGGFSY